MRRVSRFIPVLLVSAILLTTFGAASAQTPPTDPEGVVRAVFGALEAGDAKTAVSYLSDDAVLVLLPPSMGEPGHNVMQGKDAIGKWWDIIAADHSKFNLSNMHVDGNKVTLQSALTGDRFRSVGVTDPLPMDGIGILEDGKLASWTWLGDPAWVARLTAAETRAANKDTVTSWIKAFEQADQNGMQKLLADNFVNHSPPLPKDRAGMMQAAVDQLASFPDGKYTVQNIMADGDFVMLYGHYKGTHTGKPFMGLPAKGAQADFDFSLLMKLKDGKIVERWATADDVNGLLVPLGYKVVAPQ